MEDNTLEVKIPKKVPDYKYETLARSFLPFILDYFGKDENMRDFEVWKAPRKLKKNRGCRRDACTLKLLIWIIEIKNKSEHIVCYEVVRICYVW